MDERIQLPSEQPSQQQTHRNTETHNRNRNNRNASHQSSTSFNPIRSLQHQIQQPRPRQQQQHHHHHPAEHHKHRPTFNDRQPPPHLNPTTQPAPNITQTQHNHHLSTQQKPSRTGRRKEFGSKLTNQDRANSAHDSTSSSKPVNPIDLSSLSLSARLILELSSSTYDCSICISPIRPHHSIYHCPNCYAIFHLNCATKWASRSIADTSAKAILLRDRDRIPCSEEALKGEWRCPGCQHHHIGQDSIPKKYSCWCAKVENPSSRNQNSQHGHPRSKIPHSCSKRCGKIQAKGCTHGCMEECHPGSCAPCPAVIKTKCHCGKTELSIRCSQLYTHRTHLEPANSEFLSCGQVCNRDLPCGLHSCKETCHPDDCEKCPVIRHKSCYCGRLVLSDQKCSDQVTQHPLPQSNPEKITCVSEDGSQWLGEFACKDPCQRKYDCGIHSCESSCHPHQVSTPPTCPFSPNMVKTCPCGVTPLNSRQNCSDPIPTCSNPCGKIIASCGHACPNLCHHGPCGPCTSLVTTPCNCGKDKIVRRCIELEDLKKAAVLDNELKPPAERKPIETVKAEAIEYRCERPCRVLRHCGKHTCHRRCCPLSFLENVLNIGSKHKKSQAARQHEDEDTLGLHVCDLKCNKKLSCGLHNCQLQDHKGPCPTCLQASFDELFCHCGATVIQPPVPCGTKIDCHAPCQRLPPTCGHPKPPHTCHEEPDCPPCPYLTEKACQCDKKKIVKNIRCSQPKISCGSTCDNLLACGAHRCSRPCHPPGQCEACDQKCLKPRKYCGHGCQQKCHAPSSCRTEEPCEAMVSIQCGCGRIVQQIKCASSDVRPEGNQERGLKCNDDCILFQRNMAVANALQITKPLSSSESPATVDVEWSSRLLNFFGTHASFVKAIEKQLAEFLKSNLDRKATSSKNALIINTFSKLKQAFLLELVTHYRIKPETLGEEPRFTVKLTKDPNSCLPITLLSEAHANHPDAGKSYSNVDKLGTLVAPGTTLLRIPFARMAGTLTAKLEAHQSFDKGHPPAHHLPDVSMTCGPNQALSILFGGVFGFDQQSLAGLIESILDSNTRNQVNHQIKFRLEWTNDEDVLLRLPSSLPGMKTDFEQLRTIYESLSFFFHAESEDMRDGNGRKKFYKTMELVKVHLMDDSVKEIERVGHALMNEDGHNGWKSSSTKKVHSSKHFGHVHQPLQSHTSNRFSSLSSSTLSTNGRSAVNPSSSNSAGSFGDVISGGFNRPPIAVLAPVASSSHSNTTRTSTSRDKVQEEEDVVDDWETGL